jgi:two-component system sensor histidine kinase TorS
LDEFEAIARRLERERRARQAAEKLLEDKSRALYAAVEKSDRLAGKLRQTVGFRTQELLNAQRVAQVGTFIWDIKAELITWSDGVYAILGIDPDVESLSFERYLALVSAEDRAELVTQIDRTVETGLIPGSELETTHRIKRPNGEVRWVKGLGKVIESDNRDSLFLSAAIQDVTEMMQADSQVKRAQRQLKERLNELERTHKFLEKARAEAENANRTKSRFIAMISHEIRTPINGLLGTLSLLADSDLEDTQRELLQVASTSGETLRLLLNDVIDFSRLETGDIELEPTLFSIHKLTTQMIEFWQPQASSRGNQICLQIEPEVPDRLLGDSARIGQILNNLISNAIKFTYDGSITVNVRNDEQFSSEPSNYCLRIEVVDTGIGIARENLSNLFKEFSQIANVRDSQGRFYDAVGEGHGAGLGLAICRSLIERMGGKISVTSALGEGSTFSVRLPLDIADNEIISPSDPVEFQPLTVDKGRKPRALVVEDVPANQLVARMLLEKFGCLVEIANDGIEAVDACQRQSYDFVLMDVSMPRMDGVVATIQIRALSNQAAAAVPIIGLTAFAFSEEWDRFYEAGMNCVISKPIQRDVLYGEIKTVLSSGRSTSNKQAATESSSDLNYQTLSALIKGFSEDQASRVFGQVSDDLDKSRNSAIASARDGDLAGLGRSCHAIKGLAASFGGEALANLARQIEEFIICDDGERAIATALDHLGPATDAVLTALEGYAGFSAAVPDHD